MAARFAAGWPPEEIAEAVGVSVRTVYKPMYKRGLGSLPWGFASLFP
jgi:DNA-directed RNA polymerase specialized sigma24 family protein